MLMRAVLLKFVLALALLTPGIHAVAQGCDACRTTAAQSSPQAQRGLRRGIIILLVPSLLIFSGITFLAYKNRGSKT